MSSPIALRPSPVLSRPARRRGAWRRLLTIALLLVLGACSSDDGDQEAADTSAPDDAQDTQAPDTAAGDDTLAPDTQEGDDAADADDDAVTCERPEACPEGQRPVGCACVSDLDRRCLSDEDCRPEETCTAFDRASVCMYTPPPVMTCPGAPGCETAGGDALLAAAVSKVVTPDGFEVPTPAGLDGSQINFNPQQSPIDPTLWRDCGLDDLCPDDAGYPGPDDGEGDGAMQGLWLAGFTVGRPAQRCPEALIGCDGPECCASALAHDDVKVQIAVVRRGETTVAFASIDAIGFFRDDSAAILAALPDTVDVDLLVMGATHNHEAPDTAGQWGPGNPVPVVTGRAPHHIDTIHAQTVAGITEAVAALEPVTMEAGVLDVGLEGMAMSDSRPPYIFDDNIPVVILRGQDDGQVITTLLSVANHAEVLWSSNPYITSDYPHYVRHHIEQGLAAVTDVNTGEARPALAGLGGVTVMFAGAVGGLINPGRGGALDYAGRAPAEDHSFEAADAVGQRIASHVLGAVHGDALTQVADPGLRFATREFMASLRNTVFILAATQLGILKREVYNATPTNGLWTTFRPDTMQLLTQVAVVELGPVTFFTAPGEVFPETLVGGFPGTYTVQDPVVGDVEQRRLAATCDDQGLPVDPPGSAPCIISADQHNPPDWASAPQGPFVYEQIPPGQMPFFIGLGMDFLGYMVPTYDYEAAGYFDSAPGSHYEETNGVGPEITDDWERTLAECIDALYAP